MVIFAGIPTVGSALKIISSSDKEVSFYLVLSGINKNHLELVSKSKTNRYTPQTTDGFIQAVVQYSDNSTESSEIIKVIHKVITPYEKAKIATVGSGLALRNVLQTNQEGSLIVSDVDRVSQSIFIILSTSLSEIPMLPMLGSNLPYSLFKEATEQTMEQIRQEIQTALATQEPRIKVYEVTTYYDLDHTIYCTINYLITNTNIKSSYIYNIAVGG